MFYVFVFLKGKCIYFGGHISYNKLEVRPGCKTKGRDDFGLCGSRNAEVCCLAFFFSVKVTLIIITPIVQL